MCCAPRSALLLDSLLPGGVREFAAEAREQISAATTLPSVHGRLSCTDADDESVSRLRLCEGTVTPAAAEWALSNWRRPPGSRKRGRSAASGDQTWLVTFPLRPKPHEMVGGNVEAHSSTAAAEKTALSLAASSTALLSSLPSSPPMLAAPAPPFGSSERTGMGGHTMAATEMGSASESSGYHGDCSSTSGAAAANPPGRPSHSGLDLAASCFVRRRAEGKCGQHPVDTASRWMLHRDADPRHVEGERHAQTLSAAAAASKASAMDEACSDSRLQVESGSDHIPAVPVPWVRRWWSDCIEPE
jgi:hypothetical protein